MERTLPKFVQVLKITFTSNHWVINHCHNTSSLHSSPHHHQFLPCIITSILSFDRRLTKKLEATKRNRWTHWKDELLEKFFHQAKKIGLRKKTKKIRDLITQWTSKSWWVKTYYTSALLPFLPFFVSLSLSLSLILPPFLSLFHPLFLS